MLESKFDYCFCLFMQSWIGSKIIRLLAKVFWNPYLCKIDNFVGVAKVSMCSKCSCGSMRECPFTPIFDE